MEQQTIDCKVVMLPRKCNTLMKGDLYKVIDKLFIINRTTSPANGWVPQYLYFTSDEEINETGDWIIYTFEGENYLLKTFITKSGHTAGSPSGREVGKWLYIYSQYQRKVAASTDPSLRLPAIPESFIQKYVVANGKIDNVKLKLTNCGRNGCYGTTCGQYIQYGIKCSKYNSLKLTDKNEVVVVDEPAHIVVSTGSVREDADKYAFNAQLNSINTEIRDAYIVGAARNLPVGWSDADMIKAWKAQNYDTTPEAWLEKYKLTHSPVDNPNKWSDEDLKQFFKYGRGYGINGSLNKPFEERLEDYKKMKK